MTYWQLPAKRVMMLVSKMTCLENEQQNNGLAADEGVHHAMDRHGSHADRSHRSRLV
jgi:hypothetical protein